jgi:hypothetical protein
MKNNSFLDLYKFTHVHFCLAPSPPRNVSLSNITSTTVTVSWAAPGQPNGIVQGYRSVTRGYGSVRGGYRAIRGEDTGHYIRYSPVSGGYRPVIGDDTGQLERRLQVS